MLTTADYLTIAARLLAEHPELAEPAGVSIHVSDAISPIDIHVVSAKHEEALTELARWGKAHGSRIRIVEHNGHIDTSTTFSHDKIAISVREGLQHQKAYRLLDGATSVEIDPREILGETVPA